MIFQFLIGVFVAFLTFIFGLFPSIPAMPAEIVSGTTYFLNLIGGVVGVISYLVTPPIFIFAFTTIIVILNFEAVYHLAIFLLRKLPLGIK